MKPTFKDFAKVMTELSALNEELAAQPLDPEMSAAYYVLKGLLAAQEEEKEKNG
jgi:hypothetical protein